MKDREFSGSKFLSERLFKRACRVMPGGVNSPVRAFHAVGGTPVFVERASGSRIFSADGREFVDFCGAWGPLLAGHAHPSVTEAVCEAARNGTAFGTCTEKEVALAEMLCGLIPGVDKVRLVNSGTEACMTALRLARAVTGRNRVLKFAGGYHGHADAMLISAGSGLLTGGIASSPGIPDGVVADTLVAPYNDLQAVDALLERYRNEVAAVIVEPVAANMGLVLPEPGFLEGLRSRCTAAGTLLVFDEVVTGFRLGPSTWGTLCGVPPDLTCLGKIIGGGLPIGAVAGGAGIMDRLAPVGAVYQAGTLSGNPVAVAAGLRTLAFAREENPYPEMKRRGGVLGEGMRRRVREHELRAHVVRLGGMFTVFWGDGPVRNLDDARHCDADRYAVFFRGMLAEGIYLPPSPFETAFISAAHTDADIACFLEAADGVLRTMNPNPRTER